ncbi:helix-turn-helix domain-containing protein [Levilactobacillus andaensis]|uniref:helix-turn-helix domain-containing protein n=1 Tax=Levilactobacillus andaensis TaxID=2799570 RepID=UPI001940A1C2|nr:helix-turn-helix transcriptional regulator [Levilactobacillus andaensis]
MNLPERLKRCRANANLTQLQVSEKLHVSRKTISGWENGHSYPDTTSLVKISDIYNVSVDDLLRDERLLEHYADQEQAQTTNHKVMKGSYYLSIVLWLLGYIELFQPAGIHSLLIPFALITNAIVYLTHFTDWRRFRNTKYTVRAIISFFLILLAHVMINITDSNFLKYMNQSELHFVVGFIMGRILLTLIISFNFEIILFFHPIKK